MIENNPGKAFMLDSTKGYVTRIILMYAEFDGHTHVIEMEDDGSMTTLSYRTSQYPNYFVEERNGWTVFGVNDDRK
jgi:hypothetical protein